MALQLRVKCRTLRSASFLRFSSSSSSPSSPPSEGGDDEKDSSSHTQLSEYFNDIRQSLRSSSNIRKISDTKPTGPSIYSSQKSSQVSSLEEIRKNLSEFRRRSMAPSEETEQKNHSTSETSKPISFQELYRSNVIGKSEEESKAKTSNLSFDSIRESLKQLRSQNNKVGGSTTRSNQNLNYAASTLLKESILKRKSEEPESASGRGTAAFQSIFGKQMESKTTGDSHPPKTDLVKMYSYGELGEKLQKLRPETSEGKEGPFSFTELNDRLAKLRVMEEKEMGMKVGGLSFNDLRESLMKLRSSSDSSAKMSSMQRLAMLGQIGSHPTQSFISAPPKEHLVEKYLHLDNMSSKEKLKLELQKVKDEFKMSESDCGSSRVQVALLTTKIKHLSSVLHKKDKHSRRGLLSMVQRRKRLLKYLRRTDFDSYCFILDKLGIRDNPDYKI